MSRIRADDEHDAPPLDDLALLTHATNASADLHIQLANWLLWPAGQKRFTRAPEYRNTVGAFTRGWLFRA
jgi:hypothetical protein